MSVLEGMQVVELGGGIAPSLAARFLRGYGASVTRVEVAGLDRPVALTDDQRTYLLAGVEVVTTDDAALLSIAFAQADLVLSDLQPRELLTLGIDWAALRAVQPELIVVSITPFGLTGPYGDFVSTSATSFAAGGIMSLTGDPGRAPLITGGEQSFALGGANAFAAATVAWLGRLRHGRGDLIDISMQECAAGMLEYYNAATSYSGSGGQIRMGNQTRATWGIYPCVDGWAGVFALARQAPAFFALLDDPELAEPRFADPLQRLEPQNEAELAGKIYVFMAGHTMAELRELSLTSKVPFGVIMTPRQLLEAKTPADRGSWDDVVDAHGNDVRMPGRPFPGYAWSPAPSTAPSAASPTTAWAGSLTTPAKPVDAASSAEPPPSTARGPAPSPHGPARLPLEGVRILDLTMMWAGPFATLRLAEMGADVIKVESPSAWDNIRTLIPQPGIDDPWNSAFYFNAYNRDKRSLTLDLAQPEGRDTLLRLVRECDVVIENYRADVLDKLGIGYEALRAERDDIILISMAAFGKSGADKDFVGFGPVIEMTSGLCSLSGYGDGEPYKSGISYGDPVAGTFAVAAVTLGLLQRDATGKGVHVDMAQRETASVLIGDAFVAGSRGTEPVALGNRSATMAPQGCYQCAGEDQWMVISVRSDAEWDALTLLMGAPEIRGLGYAERLARHDELDHRISAWLAGQDRAAAFAALQAAGIAAVPVLDTNDLLDDPHLVARHYWHELSHPKMHTYRQQGVSWRFAEAGPAPRRHSPLFGEHNDEILRDLVGLSDAEMAALRAKRIIADAPINPGVG